MNKQGLSNLTAVSAANDLGAVKVFIYMDKAIFDSPTGNMRWWWREDTIGTMQHKIYFFLTNNVLARNIVDNFTTANAPNYFINDYGNILLGYTTSAFKPFAEGITMYADSTGTMVTKQVSVNSSNAVIIKNPTLL
ncbi:hypothetical protein [Peribacillus sp. NPDC055009]